MASEDNFTIGVTGRGGHASAPHLVIDPLVVAAEIVMALQHVVARNVDPVRTAVLSCTDLVTDGARNAIPSHVTITGDTRSFDPDVQALLERRIREISSGVAAAHGADYACLHPGVRAHRERPRLRGRRRARRRPPPSAPNASTRTQTRSWPARTSASSRRMSQAVSPSSATAPNRARAASPCTATTTASTTPSSRQAPSSTSRWSGTSSLTPEQDELPCSPPDAASTPDVAALPVWTVRTLTRQVNGSTCRRQRALRPSGSAADSVRCGHPLLPQSGRSRGELSAKARAMAATPPKRHSAACPRSLDMWGVRSWHPDLLASPDLEQQSRSPEPNAGCTDGSMPPR